MINKADRELKERELAKELDIESVSLEPIVSKPSIEQDSTNNMTWSYPIAGTSDHLTSSTSSKLHPKKKHSLTRHFVFDQFSASVSDDEKLMEKNMSDDMKKVMIRSTDTSKKSSKTNQNPMSKSMYDKPSPSGVAILDISDYMKIPSLWNKMERVGDDLDTAQEAEDSIDIANEWEIV